ncbi:hypothetical protein DPMN_116245 [Dreissena polymorpha]|uniref:Uncharacterized protein n=1 Tax=Dreissena polymorpha TaxID=45954 RepID=A0A9D4KPG9_DREPO|nr:hypothetical protein DPMN_116245 [Dreissena polymorpha]
MKERQRFTLHELTPWTVELARCKAMFVCVLLVFPRTWRQSPVNFNSSSFGAKFWIPSVSLKTLMPYYS